MAEGSEKEMETEIALRTLKESVLREQADEMWQSANTSTSQALPSRKTIWKRRK